MFVRDIIPIVVGKDFDPEHPEFLYWLVACGYRNIHIADTTIGLWAYDFNAVITAINPYPYPATVPPLERGPYIIYEANRAVRVAELSAFLLYFLMNSYIADDDIETGDTVATHIQLPTHAYFDNKIASRTYAVGRSWYPFSEVTFSLVDACNLLQQELESIYEWHRAITEDEDEPYFTYGWLAYKAVFHRTQAEWFYRVIQEILKLPLEPFMDCTLCRECILGAVDFDIVGVADNSWFLVALRSAIAQHPELITMARWYDIRNDMVTDYDKPLQTTKSTAVLLETFNRG